MKINGSNISKNGHDHESEGLDAAIQQRLNDSFWDERMSRLVCRNGKIETLRKRSLAGVGIAAALTLFVGLGVFTLRPSPSPSAATNDGMEAGAATVTTHSADRANLQAFPYRDEADVSMVLDDTYDE